MPAKRRLLPKPCPICGKDNGTVQIIIFSTSKSVICRIGHYDSETYLKSQKEREKRRRKKWCNFTIDRCFVEENILPFEQDKYDLMIGKLGKRKSITYTNPSLLLEVINEEGWHGEGHRYYQGIIKQLGLWDKFLILNPPLTDEYTYFNFLVNEKPFGKW